MSERESKFSPLGIIDISRRSFFKLAGVAGADLILTSSLVGCRGSAQEEARIIETVNLDIPGLTAEKYKVKFEEMPVPFWTSWQIQSWVKDDKNSRAYRGGGKDPFKGETWWRVSSRCGLSFTGWGLIKPFDEFTTNFYFDGNTGRFYENVVAGEDRRAPYKYGHYPNKAAKIDKELLGWSEEVLKYWSEHISCNGKVLYNVYLPSYGYRDTRHAMIIADIPNSSKIVIKDKEGPGSPIVGVLSERSSKLLLSFGYRGKDDSRGSYLVDLNNWKVIFQTDYASRGPSLNKDGSILIVYTTSNEKTGYVYNTNTGEQKNVIRWPTFLSSYGDISSPDLNFIARKVGVFSAMTAVEGQWGIFVYTPEGIFYIHSPQKSLVPEYVDDDGTIYTFDSVFKFENGTYVLSETAEKKPFEVRISKLGR